MVPEGLIRDGDGVIFFNFRADRARELTRALTDEDFKEFPRKRRLDLATYTTMTQYDETFKVPVAYAPREIRRIRRRNHQPGRMSASCASRKRKSTRT